MPAIIAGIILLSSLVIPAQSSIRFYQSQAKAESNETPPLDIKAHGVLAIDENNKELLSYHKDMKWPIASLTKLVTAIVFLEENQNLNKVVTFKKEDFVDGANLKVPVGTKIKSIDLLHSSLMSSANNATDALIRGTNLNREEFIKKMNEKAKSLGLKDTRFSEPTGLNPENLSTPREMAKITQAAISNPLIAQILEKTSHEIKPLNYPAFVIGTTNKLLKEEHGYKVLGGKTGFTDGSDYNFVTKIAKNDKEVTMVIFGDKTFNETFESAKKIADEVLKSDQ